MLNLKPLPVFVALEAKLFEADYLNFPRNLDEPEWKRIIEVVKTGL